MNKFQNAPGRVKFDNVLIQKHDSASDITPLVSEVNIFSSIVDTTSQAKFFIIDAKALMSRLPVEPGDKISFVASYPDGEQTHSFIITKISNIASFDKQMTYVIESVSQLAFKSLYTNISKHFKGTASDIAFSIFQTHTKEDHGIWDASVGTQSVIVPQWNPIKAIKWLADRARASNDDTRFIFFQDSQQKFHFAPLEKFRELYKAKPAMKYFYRRNNQLVDGKPNSAAAMETILDLSYHDAFDYIQQTKTGKFGGTRFQTDINTKTLEITNYNYWTDFKPDKYLNNSPSWKPNLEAARGFLQFDHILSHTDDQIAVGKTNDKSNIKRSTLDKSQYITIVVHGNQTVDVGQVLDIKIPSAEPKSRETEDLYDLRWSGKYYVVAKRDLYTKEGQQTALTLAKESMATSEGIK